jgi:hypothetical protein
MCRGDAFDVVEEPGEMGEVVTGRKQSRRRHV